MSSFHQIRQQNSHQSRHAEGVSNLLRKSLSHNYRSVGARQHVVTHTVQKRDQQGEQETRNRETKAQKHKSRASIFPRPANGRFRAKWYKFHIAEWRVKRRKRNAICDNAGIDIGEPIGRRIRTLRNAPGKQVCRAVRR